MIALGLLSLIDDELLHPTPGKAMVDETVVAPAPGSPETASASAEGARGERTPSPAARQGAQRGKAVIYADVHRTKKHGEGFRITFTADGIAFKHVDSFLDLPVEEGDMVFVDTLPLQHTDAVIELLRRGVEVYYLRRLTLIAKKREELRLSKTTKNDIKILMTLGAKWFKRVDENFLVMRRLLSAYRMLLKTHISYTNQYKAMSETVRNNLRPVIRALEEEMDEMAVKISDEAGRRYSAYNKLVAELGIGGNVGAVEALAEIVAYLDLDKGFRKTANLFGFFKPIRGRRKIYDGRLRQALQRLTCATNGITSFKLTAKLEKQTLFKVWKTCKEETRGRLAIPAQG